MADKREIDFVAYAEDNDGNKTRVGVAFRHSKGEGLNVLLNALPMDKKLVLFPPPSEDEA